MEKKALKTSHELEQCAVSRNMTDFTQHWPCGVPQCCNL